MFVENNNEEVVDSAETTTEALADSDAQDASTSETKVAETTESSKQQSGETPEQRRARIKRMYEREFGKQGSEGGQESDKENSKTVDDERYTRLELKTEGVTTKKAQDVVLKYISEAKLLGKDVDIASALKSAVVREEIAQIEKSVSAPPPSKRTSTGASDSFEYWATQARKGNWPRHDREMMSKLKKARIFTS